MTETDHHNNFAFSAPATELVTVAAEYCKALEGQDFKNQSTLTMSCVTSSP